MTIANTAGQWLFAVVAWRQAPGYPQVDFHLEDDAHNWWEPMGAPGGTSPSGNDLRIAVWRAPAARAGTVLCVAPNGFVVSTAVTVLEVDGPLPWVTETTTVTAFSPSATSLTTLTASSPGAYAFWITAVARGLNSVTTSFPAGWTPGPMASTNDTLDHSSDLTLMTAFTETAGAVSAAWSGDAACDMAGILTGILITADEPTMPGGAWPATTFSIAPGSGVATPASEITWVNVDTNPVPRFFDFTFTQGSEYEVASLQAGQGQVTLGNPDLALVPPGTGVFTGVDSGTPWRALFTWPGGGAYPSIAAPWYVIRGFFERLPPSWDPEVWYGWIQSTVIDAWAYCQAQMQSALRSEVLASGPYAYWPLGDVAGTTYASNLAAGGTSPLIQVASPYGVSTATAAFGASAALSTAESAVTTNAGGLPGDGGTVWEQDNLPAAVTTTGYTLYCQDPNFPPLNATAGASIEGWHSLTGTALYQTSTLWAIKSTKGPIMRAWADTSGLLNLSTWDVSGTEVDTALTTTSYLGTGLFQICVTWVAGTGWTAYVDGVSVATSGSVPNLAPSFAWISANGENDRFTTGYCYDGQVAHLAVYPLALPPARVAANYQAGATGLITEGFPSRVERLLSYGGYTGRRVIETSPVVDQCASLSDLGVTQVGQAGEGFKVPSPAGSGTVQAGQQIASLVTSTTPAMVYVAPTGAVYSHVKGRAFGEAVRWVLGDDPANGEIPYADDAAFDYDPQRVINGILITQIDRQDVVTPQTLSPNAAAAVTVPQSQGRYSVITDQFTGYLFNDLTTPLSSSQPSSLIDLANWLALSYAVPHLRVQQITVDAVTYPAAWPLVLGVSPGDIATVIRRPPQAAPAFITLTARVTQVSRRFQWGGPNASPKATVTLLLDYCPELNPLTLDSTTLGVLSGTPVLTW